MPRPAHSAPRDHAIVRYHNTRSVEIDPRRARANRVISHLHDHGVIDAYRLLRTRIRHRMAQHGWITLGITSPGAGEGKSLTAINLALSLARDPGHSVLLIDADLRRPNIHRTLGIQPAAGLADHLLHGVALTELLLHPLGIERCVLLPGNPAAQAVPELLSSARMGRLIDEVRSRYPQRLVIFDLPPVLIGDDVVTLAPALDTLLLVTAEGVTDSADLGRTLELLEGYPIIGTLLNRSSELPRGYGDYYR